MRIGLTELIVIIIIAIALIKPEKLRGLAANVLNDPPKMVYRSTEREL